MLSDVFPKVGVQFPASLEFTECYLRDVWDTALLPVFDTFIFDSEHDRAVARAGQETPLMLHSAWQWEQQFDQVKDHEDEDDYEDDYDYDDDDNVDDQEYIASWENPLECGVPIRPPRRNASDPSEASMIMSQSMKQTDPGKEFVGKCFLRKVPSLYSKSFEPHL